MSSTQSPENPIHDFHVQLHDTDAAGRLFFGHLFRHAHDAYEVFMRGLGFPLERLIGGGEILLPLVHAEADFCRPLSHGERVGVFLAVEDLRARSFTIVYRFETADGRIAATARTRHVQVTRDGSVSDHLDGPLHDALSQHLQVSDA